MKKMLLMVLLLLLLTGCGISNPMGEQQEGDDPPEGPSVSVNDPSPGGAFGLCKRSGRRNTGNAGG